MFFEPVYEKFFQDSEGLEQQIRHLIEAIDDLPEMAHRCKRVYGHVPRQIDEVFKDDPITDKSPYLWEAAALAERIADEYLEACYFNCDIDEPEKRPEFEAATETLGRAIARWQEVNREAILENPESPTTHKDSIIEDALGRFLLVAQDQHYVYAPDYKTKVSIEYTGSWLKEMFGSGNKSITLD